MIQILLLMYSLLNYTMGGPLRYLPILILFSISHKDVDDDDEYADDENDEYEYDAVDVDHSVRRRQ